MARSPGKRVLQFIYHYFMVAGIAAHVLAFGALVYFLNEYDLTAHQAVDIALARMGVDSSTIRELFRPAPAFADHRLDGRLRDAHPRILFPQLANAAETDRMAFMDRRLRAYRNHQIDAPDPCRGGGLPGRAACWFITGNEQAAQQAVAEMLAFRLTTPSASGDYGNGWELAFAFDLLSGYPGLTDDEKSRIRAKIEQALSDYLLLLDDASASLWHGRSTLAAAAWLCAVVLEPDTAKRRELITRAQAHFLDVIRALELTEAWPEGYNYWINTRAFIVALAASAYVNGLENAERGDEVRAALVRTMHWNLYATRPDNRIEGLGDEGPRVDLKDETRRVIDLIAQLGWDPLLAAYSTYTHSLHGRESYYRGYRWGFRLFNDPEIPLPVDIKSGTLEGLERYLPRAELFGEGAFDQLYVRSGWDKDATFISFRAGDSFVHHGHYDAGHFTLFKGAPLAITSGTYGDFFSEHRLNYAIRTVAKNSLLVLRPNEKVHPNRFFGENVAAGGQRITLPTGSAITSTRNWADNLGAELHLEGGRVVAFHDEADQYAYIATDLTSAYNTPAFDAGGSGGKVSSVSRELLYLYDEDRLLIHDHVVSVDPSYTKKWLLHTVNRPIVEGLEILQGKSADGILQSRAASALVHNGRGRLRLDRIYPQDARIRLVGGPDYRFYAETDGDDADLDGRNMANGAHLKPWFDTGMWRIELQPAGKRNSDHFLVSLTPSLDDYRKDGALPLSVSGTEAYGLKTQHSLVIFTTGNRSGKIAFDTDGGPTRLYVLGLPASTPLRVRGDSVKKTARSNEAGVSRIDLKAFEPGRLQLSW